MPSVYQCALAANAIYDEKQKSAGSFHLRHPYGNPGSGLFLGVYDDEAGRCAIVAIRGTQLTDLEDLKSDIQIAFGQVPDEALRADSWLKHARPERGGREVWLTGHSLGGGIAALLAVKNGLPVVTFNAPGVARAFAYDDLLRPMGVENVHAIDMSRILHVRSMFDPVSLATGRQFGDVRSIWVEHDLTPAALTMIGGPVLGVSSFLLQEHSMDRVLSAVARTPEFHRDLRR